MITTLELIVMHCALSLSGLGLLSFCTDRYVNAVNTAFIIITAIMLPAGIVLWAAQIVEIVVRGPAL